MQDPRVLGIVGWSGSGKTALLIRLIPLLTARGLRVATLKHAHHEFDVDTPGKDSWEHRQAGASEVIICSARRWVQMHELGNAPEPTLAQLLRRVTPCDLVLIEGFKQEQHPKLEVYRSALGALPLYPTDAHVLAVATDTPLQGAHPPVVDLNDTEAVAAVVLRHAAPLMQVLDTLEAPGGTGTVP
ncbi:MAG: molybdopterin-guanine dinucleotide biosynthesis protein B [Steroidobacteraceae bacterium]